MNVNMKKNKKCLQGFVVLLFVLFIQYNQAFGQNAVAVADTRAINELPGDFSREVKFDFKFRYIVGVPGVGNYSTMMTLAPWSDASGDKNHQLNFNDGGVFYRNGYYGGNGWGVWRKILMEDEAGNVGIGTDVSNERLSVNGKIRAREIKVEALNWPDYVFKPDYKRISLQELDKYIKSNGHLPDMPSASEVEKNGVELGEMNKLLLKKIEELTLHVIELNKKIEGFEQNQKK